MEKEVLFLEKQRFTQPMLWISLLPVLLWPIAIDWKEIVSGNTSQLVSNLIVPALLIVLFLLLNLKTVITEKGVFIRFFPFVFGKEILWEEIDRAYVRKYKLLLEYGGWGLKYGFKAGKAYNVKGNMGLQLVLKDGKKILIGTQKGAELEELLENILAQKNDN